MTYKVETDDNGDWVAGHSNLSEESALSITLKSAIGDD